MNALKDRQFGALNMRSSGHAAIASEGYAALVLSPAGESQEAASEERRDEECR